MSATAIEIKPLSGSLGAEVLGPNLARPLDRDAFGRIERAFLDHQVLFFRDQEITPAQLVDFAARFGPIGRYPLAEPIPEHPDIIAVVKEPGQTTIFGGVWHSDTAYLEAPSLGSLLYAKEVPATGGDTLFANMYLAYESLSPGLRRLLDGLSAVNSAGKNKETLRGDHLASGAMAGTAADARGLQAEHPVVRRHPVTGRKALYVNRAHTLRFSDMTEAEPLYKSALVILEKALGPEHPQVAAGLENYADLLRKTGRDAEAERMEARAKAIRAKSE